jgi:hypothetical protein
MSPIAARGWLHRPLRRLAIVLVVLVVGGAVVAHHTMPEMPGMAAAAACLFIVGGSAIAVAAVAVALPLRLGPLLAPALPTPPVRATQSAPARAGPIYLALLVLRR